MPTGASAIGAGELPDGAELTEAGDMGGALVRFVATLDAGPGWREARLQWVMVLLALGRGQAAIEVLAGMASVALHHVAPGDLKMAAVELGSGLALRHPNRILASDMAALMAHVEHRMSDLAPSAAVHAPAYDAPEHFLVRAYDSMSNP